MIKKHIVIICCFSATAVLAAGFDCPKTVRTRQNIENRTAGWDVFIDTVNAHHHLDHVDFYDGSPKEGAQLAPDNADSGTAPVWTFSARLKESIWQTCVYTDTLIQLSRPLPDTIKSCRAIYPKGSLRTSNNHPIIDSIVCQ